MSYVDTHGIRHYACMCEHDGQFRVEWCMASDGDHEDGIGPMWAPTAREALVVAQQSVQLMQQRVRTFEVYIESDDAQLGRYIPLPMHSQKRYSTAVFVSTLVTNELSADHMLIVGWFTGHADAPLQQQMQQEVEKYAAQLREISM